MMTGISHFPLMSAKFSIDVTGSAGPTKDLRDGRSRRHFEDGDAKKTGIEGATPVFF